MTDAEQGFGPRCRMPGRWPHRAIPQPDELLSSWIARSAAGTGLKTITLLNAVFGSNRSMLNQDLDVHLPQHLLAMLAAGGGLDEEAVAAMTLSRERCRLASTDTPRGRRTWILPTTVLSNHRLRPGLQCCPECLRHDAEPYLRRRWRLAFVTTCTGHGISLLDRCPHCGSPMHPHGAPTLRHCAKCGEDLCAGPRKAATVPALEQQAEWEATLSSGWGMIAGRPVTAPMFFITVRRLAGLVALGPSADDFRAAAAEKIIGADPSPSFEREDPRHPLEYLSIGERARLFGIVGDILARWPGGFLEACRAARITRCDVIKDMAYVPFALDSVLKEHLEDKPYKASEAEVAAAAAWLRRTRGVATYRELKAHCGESRAAIYRHMDYERVPATPSAWLQRAKCEPDGMKSPPHASPVPDSTMKASGTSIRAVVDNATAFPVLRERDV